MPRFDIQQEHLPFLNISLYLNNKRFFKSLSITNTTAEAIDSIEIKITADISCIAPFGYYLSSAPPNDIIKIPLDKLQINRVFLNNLSEVERAQIHISVLSHNQEEVLENFSIEVQPTGYFPGFTILPGLIASFVTPNHPYVYHLQRRAVDNLETKGYSLALDGYQSERPERVLQIFSALYSAIQEEQIIYSSLPPGYEKTGQRLRLLNAIQNEHLANCIDLSLLFAACLEACELNPILIITKGHAFVGCWLDDDKFPNVINQDKAALTKRISKGISEIAVVEATSICRGNETPFSVARNLAEAELLETDNFILSVDIKSARGDLIRPIPLSNEGGKDKLDMESVEMVASLKMEDAFDLGSIYKQELLDGQGEPLTKQKVWERSLLDLSLRNNLLNLHMSRNMLQLVDLDIGHLENTLFEGGSYSLMPDSESEVLKKYNLLQPPLHPSLPKYQKANNEIHYNRLLTYYHPTDLDHVLTHIHRNAKKSIEESGSSTLFLALGLLKWFDRKSPLQPRYAPILLLPVEIKRRSVRSQFKLSSREEETMINITLLEYLRQEYQLDLGQLEDLPGDEQGVDVSKVMAIVRRAIMSLEGWDVLEQLVLGNFSFSKLILWNDITKHKEDLVKSDIVRSLMEGKLAFSEEQLTTNSENLEMLPSEDILLPLPGDAFQMEAIRTAQKGQSFILHGPPGTGKSQTITNIIINALYQGKRVLFVAAKKAALEVVYHRLKEVGLDSFVLELHSDKAKKTDVLKQLSRSLETLKMEETNRFHEQSEGLDKAKKAISGYVRILHKKQPIGWSLYDSITALEAFRNRDFSKNYIPNPVYRQLTPSLLEKWNFWLPQFESALQIIEHPSENPLSVLSIQEYSASVLESIKSQTPVLLDFLTTLKKELPEIITALDFPFPILSLKDLKNFSELVREISRLPRIPLSFAAYLSDEEKAKIYEEWARHFKDYQTALKNLLAENNRSILEADLTAIEVEWKKTAQSWLLPKYFGKKKVIKLLNAYRKQPIQTEGAIEKTFEDNRQLQEAERVLAQDRFVALRESLGPLNKGEQTDLMDIRTKAGLIIRIARIMTAKGYHAMEKWIGVLIEKGISQSDELKDKLKAYQEDFLKTVTAFLEAQEKYKTLAGFHLVEDDEAWLDKAIQELNDVQAALPYLKDWMNYQKICKEGESLELQWLIEAYEAKKCKSGEVADYFNYTLHISLFNEVIAKHDFLSLFNVDLFDSKVAQYRKLAKEYKPLIIEEIYRQLTSKIPNNAIASIKSSEPGILNRAIRSRGRGKSIRKLFDEIPNLLPRLTPCMLMSPMSVAQYFTPDKKHFDLLIFDEASQLPTCEAVSALARAQQVIIVGDPKQMPPTSFFASSKPELENIELEDLESILDDCLALSVPSKHLLRHYRSRHESLIAFSNVKYYENKLLTFPSADEPNRKVLYHPVEGYYDKGKSRTNKFEAEAIIRYIHEHLADPLRRKYSLGVISFSQAQQSLIEEQLDRFFAEYPDFEAFANEGEESLFVKNLENVQGDERDVILFSIGYGPDKDGKVSMNFGPLNRAGGWRRLNVAVSRSRYEMHVFATLSPEQIDLSRTSSIGAAGLKGFLSFAATGLLPRTEMEEKKNKNNKAQLANYICKRLGEKGLQVKENVGVSDFKIDIGIVHPEKPEQFILGILVDGDYYYKAQTSNDRELVLPAVLKSLGWHIFKVWSLDWFENAAQIVENILDKVNQLLKNEDTEPIGNLKTSLLDDEKFINPIKNMEAEAEQQIQTLQKPYSVVTLSQVPYGNSEEFFLPRNADLIIRQIQKTVNVEGPISKGLLYSRILGIWNISRSGSRLDRYLKGLIEQAGVYTIQHQEPFYVSRKEILPLAYYRSNDVENRKIEDIAPEEIIVALEEVVKNNYSIDDNELMRYLGRLFNFSRIGSHVEKGINYAFDLAVEQGKIQKEGDKITLAKE